MPQRAYGRDIDARETIEKEDRKGGEEECELVSVRCT